MPRMARGISREECGSQPATMGKGVGKEGERTGVELVVRPEKRLSQNLMYFKYSTEAVAGGT